MNPPLDAMAPRTAAWREAEIPAANGHGNARSVARIHSAIACAGEVDGVRLLSESGCRKIFDVQTDGEDLVLVGLCFGTSSGNPRYSAACDLNNDGRVNNADLSILEKNFGNTGG